MADKIGGMYLPHSSAQRFSTNTTHSPGVLGGVTDTAGKAVGGTSPLSQPPTIHPYLNTHQLTPSFHLGVTNTAGNAGMLCSPIMSLFFLNS